MTTCSNVLNLDPIEGLLEYVKDIKPYHTKIVEVVIEYVYDDLVSVAMSQKRGESTPTNVQDQIEFNWGGSAWSGLKVGDTITINGNLENALQIGDVCSISNCASNFEIQQVVVGGSPATTQVTMTADIDCVADGQQVVMTIPHDVTANFQFSIVSADEITGILVVQGNAMVDIQVGQEFVLVGTVADGVQVAKSSPIYSVSSNTTTIFVGSSNIASLSAGGYIQPIRWV